MGVRKAGTKLGKPHYSVECDKCHRVLASGHVSKERGTAMLREHMASSHGKR